MNLKALQFLVTGVGGWLGRVTLEVLTSTCGPDAAARIIAVGRREGMIHLAGGQKIVVYPWHWLRSIKGVSPVVVFHHAFVTKGQAGNQSEGSYRQANLEIQQVMAQFLSQNNVAGLMVPSSGAVYTFLNKTAAATEPLFQYGRCKYEDERVFAELADQGGFRAVIPRIFNLSGPYINNHQGYALSSFILNCLNLEDIHVRADHEVWRSYYSADALVRLVLGIISAPVWDQPLVFDTVGEEVVEVGELAQRCLHLLDNGQREVRRPIIKPMGKDYYVGTPAVIRDIERVLGMPPVALDAQILETAEFLKKERGL
jgi:nucleoside-diphosphate-sugar epimerase